MSPPHNFASYQNLIDIDTFSLYATAPMKIDYLGARTNLDLPTSPGNARNGLLGETALKEQFPKLDHERPSLDSDVG